MKTAAVPAAIASLLLAGTAVEAAPLAPLAGAEAPVVDVATVVTRTVRRGPLGSRVITKRIVRRPRPVTTTVTTTRTVR